MGLFGLVSQAWHWFIFIFLPGKGVFVDPLKGTRHHDVPHNPYFLDLTITPPLALLAFSKEDHSYSVQHNTSRRTREHSRHNNRMLSHGQLGSGVAGMACPQGQSINQRLETKKVHFEGAKGPGGYLK